MKNRRIGWILLISLLVLTVGVFGCSGKKGEDAVKQEESIIPASAAPLNDEIDIQKIQEDEITMPGGNGNEDVRPTMPTETEVPTETAAPETTQAPEVTAAPEATNDPLEIDPDPTPAPEQQTPTGAPQTTETPKPADTPKPGETPSPTPDNSPIELPELP